MLVQSAAAVVTDRRAVLTCFDRLAGGIHCQGFRMGGGDTGNLLVEIDQDIDDIVVMFIIGDQDHFYDAEVIAAIVDADADGGITFFTDLCQQQADGIGIERLCMTELHGVLEAFAVLVEAVDRGPEVSRILNGEPDGNDMGFDAV